MFLKIVAGAILWFIGTIIVVSISVATDGGDMRFGEAFIMVCLIELLGLVFYLIFGRLVFWCIEVLAS